MSEDKKIQFQNLLLNRAYFDLDGCHANLSGEALEWRNI